MQKDQIAERKNKWDRIGFFLSILCAIHCASMPLLITLLPLLASTFLHNSMLELVLIGSTVSIAGVLILKDYFQLHRNLLPLSLLILGVSAKLLGIFVLQHQYEPVIITSGAAFILLSYIANWKLRTIHKTACKC